MTKLNSLFISDTIVSGLSDLQNLSKLYMYPIKKYGVVSQNDIAQISLSLTHLNMSFNNLITHIMHLTHIVHWKFQVRLAKYNNLVSIN